ncbi:TRAP transporter large permease [Ottowia sp.]|uniref:TRAP transporter large permease n=1 Tax=Ottowia sp. TaxID=1898956 RepID=UPI0025EBC5EE|nr:TRAP transporter large permease [Ottowia sp.]MBK6616802.1 TRAP transporter large permease [Ottowia sp.]
MELLLLTSVFLGSIILSLDIALAMILSSAVLLLVTGVVPIHLIAEKSVSQVSLYPLLAIPGFIVAGELMNVTGLTRSLGELARLLVGRWRGGMGHATVLACMIFGGMTGSGLAETVAIGTLMIPLLARHGYPKSFAASIVAAGGSLGPIIPPSIPMVIYASIAPGVSVAALFIGGIVPGILIGVSFMVIVAWKSRTLVKTPIDVAEEPSLNARRVIVTALPALLVPVIVLFGTLGGRVTVTEASVLVAAYVLLYGLVNRTITAKSMFEAASNTAMATGLFGFIIAAAGPFAFFLALYQAPQAVGELLLQMSFGSPDLLMIELTLILLVLGCLVEATSLVIILAPILAATATVAGIDQVHMALVSITALMIGLFSPPVGTNLFAVVGLSREPFHKVAKDILPFVYSAGVVVLILAVWPSLVTWLPHLLIK